MNWQLLEEALRRAPGPLYVTELRAIRTPFGPMFVDPVSAVLGKLRAGRSL
ncbi:hypothetical protein [Nonomuraea africana]|uniref:Uncharacterized protein n=1 Tax=Nonomuraea africana TaxID=46171 RepID=A0ABR9K6W3_9ACTN|nr:hypothetical protein [Nonomuraea africana]MBE1557635.1 hypothetical protein [Nonomuraea africana]